MGISFYSYRDSLGLSIPPREWLLPCFPFLTCMLLLTSLPLSHSHLDICHTLLILTPVKISSLPFISFTVKSKLYQGLPGIHPPFSPVYLSSFISPSSHPFSSFSGATWWVLSCLLHAVFFVWKPFSNSLTAITHSSSLNLKDTSSRIPSLMSHVPIRPLWHKLPQLPTLPPT